MMKQRKGLITPRQSELKKPPSSAAVVPAEDKHQALTNGLNLTSGSSLSLKLHFLNIDSLSCEFLASWNAKLLSCKTIGARSYLILSYDIASWSEITPCNKMDKPLVVYRF